PSDSAISVPAAGLTAAGTRAETTVRATSTTSKSGDRETGHWRRSGTHLLSHFDELSGRRVPRPRAARDAWRRASGGPVWRDGAAATHISSAGASEVGTEW